MVGKEGASHINILGYFVDLSSTVALAFNCYIPFYETKIFFHNLRTQPFDFSLC